MHGDVKFPDHFGHRDLMRCARGELFGKEGPRLPLPPMLMITAIDKITEKTKDNDRGIVAAHWCVTPRDWYFKCHFSRDPVMPGCLGLDALWQLLGFYLGWMGFSGKGRALGLGSLRFESQILPEETRVLYHLDVRRVVGRDDFALGMADGMVSAGDGTPVYLAKGLRVGLFSRKDSFPKKDGLMD